MDQPILVALAWRLNAIADAREARRKHAAAARADVPARSPGRIATRIDTLYPRHAGIGGPSIR